jgi:protein SCO1/2
MTLCVAATLCIAATNIFAEEAQTNTVHRSCCMAAEAPVKPLKEKSLYQLDSTWTNDNGKTVQLSSLRGRPQIVAMFFASCQFTCPLTVAQMKQIEAALPPEIRAKVGFTLISFDSVHDTPDALKNYRTQHGLSSDNWTLLNGSPDSVLDFSAVLGVKFKQDAQGQFSHSNLITLLNSDGEIVRQFPGLNPDTEQLKVEIEKLIGH